MSAFRRAGEERVNAFAVDGTYYFSHYFEGEAVFDRLQRYYDNQQYRFEVPEAAFSDVQSFLAEHGYGLVGVAVTDPFVVVVRKYTAHPENIFKGSVAQRDAGDYNCFLMATEEAVERAVADGAAPVEKTPLENPF